MNRSILALSALSFILLGCNSADDAAPESSPNPSAEASAATDAVAVTPAAVAELIDREKIFGNPEQAQGRISPDGKYVSWLAPVNNVLNVWVAPADDLAAARAITQDTSRGINNHFWSPDARFVYYQQDKGGNENFHVYAANVETGEVRDLSPFEESVRAGIQAVSKERPGEVLIAANARNPQLFDLYLVDVATGERELVAENPGYGGWLVDNTLTPRFGMKQTATGGADYVDMEGNTLFSVPVEDVLTTNAFGFDATNNYIFAVDSRGRDKAALVKMAVADGSTEVLAQSDTADISDVLLDPNTFEPLAYAVDYLRNEWTPLTEETGKDLAFLDDQLVGDFDITSATDDLSRVVVYAESAQAPGVYLMYDRKAQTLTELFSTRPDLTGAPLQPMHPVEIPSRDGLTLVSYLTLPPGSDEDGDGRPDSPQAMVLDVHGGPWARDNYGYNAWHQWLSNRGYAVLSVNYRGSTGFGKDFVNAAVGEFAGKMHDDLIDGVNWAVSEGIAKEDQVAIAGGSYGGYATLIGVSFTPDTFACGVDLVGPSSLVTLIESFPDYWKPFLEGSWFKYVGDPSDADERADMYNRSAISRVDDISVPLLIGQGQNDPRVTKNESDQLVAAMDERELPVTYVNFPDEGHGFVRPENRLAFYSVMEGFLSRCLGGRAEPIGDAFAGSSVEILHGEQYVEGLAAAVEKMKPAAEAAAEG
ncbi:MAG: S9 family peptidase [Pseudomonadota bacterium]